MSSAPRDYPPGDFRVSDADRDRAVAELSRAFQVGQITRDEFDERSGRALGASTGKELAALLADLPPDGAAPARKGIVERAHQVVATRIAAGASAATAAGLTAVALTNALSTPGAGARPRPARVRKESCGPRSGAGHPGSPCQARTGLRLGRHDNTGGLRRPAGRADLLPLAPGPR